MSIGKMEYCYVVSKSRKIRIPCDGPLTAQIERVRLEGSIKAAGDEPDVEIEYPKTKPPRARGAAGRMKSDSKRLPRSGSGGTASRKKNRKRNPKRGRK
jgi:hypothetical protein